MERLFVGREYTVRFNFALTPAQDEWIRQQAFEQRVSKADIVRGLIDRAMKGEAHQMRMEDLIQAATTAERIAELLLNDGMRFETEDGRTLDELTEEAGGHIIKHETDDLWRHVFPDGSAIVMSPGAWDIEGSAPFSWAGAE